VEPPESKHGPFLDRDEVRAYWLGVIDRFIAERMIKPAQPQSALNQYDLEQHKIGRPNRSKLKGPVIRDYLTECVNFDAEFGAANCQTVLMYRHAFGAAFRFIFRVNLPECAFSADTLL
jgi:hypothetical protein